MSWRVAARRLGLALGWMLVLAAAGVAMLPLLGWSSTHKVPVLTRQLVATGIEFGLDFYLFGLFFGVLPGLGKAVRRPGGPPPPWGPAQAVWALLGFGAMLAAGGLAAYNILLVGNFALDAAHAGWHADPTGGAATAASVIGGEAAAALWICWYFVQAGPAHLADGGPLGLAWRPAPARAYGFAGLCAAAIIGAVMVLYHFIPPNLEALNNLPMAKLFSGSDAQVLPMLLVVTLIGPMVEEMVFRGAAFAGFARRFGPLGASAITTVIFMALHEAEKRYYLPGFIDVGLMAVAACWLRVKYGSIKPGILLHILYNTGLMLAAGIS